MTSDSFINHPALQSFMFKDPVMSSMQNVLLTYGLILEFYSFEKSKFSQYIKSLPEIYDSCPYYDIEDFEMLKGSVSFRDALNTWKSVVRQYAYFHLKIIQNQESSDENEFKALNNLSENFSYEDYRWAASTVLAKSFSFESLGGSTGGVVLIPLIDLCPHADTITSFNFEQSEQSLNITNGLEIVAGDLIKIFYGAKTNSQLVLSHGFFYSENLHEFFLLRIPLKESASYKNRTNLLIKVGIIEHNGVPIGSISEDVWNSDIMVYMRIREANDEELNYLMSLSDEELVNRLNSAEPLNERNENAAKSELKTIIQEKITALKENFEKESELLLNSETPNKIKNIIKLKHSELSTFESFIKNLMAADSKPKIEQ